MDCFIVRIYRQTEQGEIVGLLERPGDRADGSPFSGYSSLVERIRSSLGSGVSDTEHGESATDARLRIVHSSKKY